MHFFVVGSNNIDVCVSSSRKDVPLGGTMDFEQTNVLLPTEDIR